MMMANEWETSAPVSSPSPVYRSSSDGRLVSLCRPSPGISALSFLKQAQGQERFYWEDVRDGITYAGFGLAVNLLAWGEQRFEHIQEQARALFAGAALLGTMPAPAAPRLFGGFAFRNDFVPDNTWSVYHPAHFVLPHYQLVQIGQESWLTINVLLPPDEEPETMHSDLQAALDARYRQLKQEAERGPADTAARQPIAINYPMNYEEWEAMLNRAKAAFAETDLQKVVLAREAELRFPEHVAVDHALVYLDRHYNDSFRFLFEPRPYHAFYGATPELLARVHGETLTTMALAGSAPRSADDREDAALGQALLHSEKDRHEHELVVMSLLERLAPITAQLEISPQPGIYKLRNIQHLLTPIRATLLTAGGILPVVRLLHPTPALGGRPRRLALDFIQKAEPVPRGWYAAPIGWLDVNLDGAFAVGIRSAVAQDRRVWLYAGAGIVPASDPAKEWEETALKFKPMLEALGVD